MIAFHTLYDLNFFNILSIRQNIPFFHQLAYPIGTLFLMLVGISLTLSYQRRKQTMPQRRICYYFFIRGLKILGLGIIITIGTWLYLQEGFIIFGILHLIGVSIILAIPFLSYRWFNILLGIIFIIIGTIVSSLKINTILLIWAGITPLGFYTVDYYPLLPWFGVVLIGIALGNMFYTDYQRQFTLQNHRHNMLVKPFSFLGRHALSTYVLHQPLLVGIITVFLITT